MLLCDKTGIIYKGGEENMNPAKQWLAENTNQQMITGSISSALIDADIFIGVSVPNLISVEDIKRMADDPLVVFSSIDLSFIGC